MHASGGYQYAIDSICHLVRYMHCMHRTLQVDMMHGSTRYNKPRLNRTPRIFEYKRNEEYSLQGMFRSNIRIVRIFVSALQKADVEGQLKEN